MTARPPRARPAVARQQPATHRLPLCRGRLAHLPSAAVWPSIVDPRCCALHPRVRRRCPSSSHGGLVERAVDAFCCVRRELCAAFIPRCRVPLLLRAGQGVSWCSSTLPPAASCRLLLAVIASGPLLRRSGSAPASPRYLRTLP